MKPYSLCSKLDIKICRSLSVVSCQFDQSFPGWAVWKTGQDPAVHFDKQDCIEPKGRRSWRRERTEWMGLVKEGMELVYNMKDGWNGIGRGEESTLNNWSSISLVHWGDCEKAHLMHEWKRQEAGKPAKADALVWK